MLRITALVLILTGLVQADEFSTKDIARETATPPTASAPAPAPAPEPRQPIGIVEPEYTPPVETSSDYDSSYSSESSSDSD